MLACFIAVRVTFSCQLCSCKNMAPILSFLFSEIIVRKSFSLFWGSFRPSIFLLIKMGPVYVSRSSSSCVGSDIDRGAISYITMGESTYRLPCSTRRRLFHGGHMTQADGGFMGSGFVCSTPPNKKRENVHDSVRHWLS